LSAEGDTLYATGGVESKSFVPADDPRFPEKLWSVKSKDVAGEYSQGDCDIAILDLVVVGGEIIEGAGTISRISGTGQILHALSVTWKDGIVMSHVRIAEEPWVSLKNRGWKLGTLK
jgi:hypothetical protein